MSELVRVPERAATRIQAALQRLEQMQAVARETVETVADALGVPQGWALGGDEEGLYFGAAPKATDGAESRDTAIAQGAQAKEQVES